MATKQQFSIPKSSIPYSAQCSDSQLNHNQNQSNLLNKVTEHNNQSSNCKTEIKNSYLEINSVYNHLKRPLQQDESLCQFSLNDLVWAKLKNSPWWPCQIVRDLVGDNEFRKIIGMIFFKV
jgi:hypothetical protein